MDESKVKSEQETIRKEMAGGFNDLAKHEIMIRRMEEVKRDSIKIKLLEDVLKKLGEVHIELKTLNIRNEKNDKNREMEKKATNEHCNKRYV